MTYVTAGSAASAHSAPPSPDLAPLLTEEVRRGRAAFGDGNAFYYNCGQIPTVITANHGGA